jgi:mannose-1-phosphate guanylyltransferase
MLHAIIMAGGSGTRFWPESRHALPKQLLRLVGERTMLQATVDRLSGLIPLDRTLIVTGSRLVDEIAKQLPELNHASIVGEPCKRDTAPCIGLAAMLVSRDDPDATMAVMPSDHVIATDADFQSGIELAAALVDAAPARIVTFGIRPTYPAESFGYIERGEKLSTPSGFSSSRSPSIFRVARFREKPKAEVAQQYVESGQFDWNSGIFVWKARTILAALEARQPEMYERLRHIVAAIGKPDFAKVFEREFTTIKGISIDYAVMEHAQDVAVIEAPFTWDDVGSWQAIARLEARDAEGNTILAKHLGLDTKGCIVRGPDDHLIVTLGVQDCIVVHTPDATLVANKHDEEAIRQLVQLIEKKGWTEYL